MDMETFVPLCEGFHFPSGTQTLSIQIKNQNWTIKRKIDQNSRHNYRRQYINGYNYYPLIVELQRPDCTERINGGLVIYSNLSSISDSWQKYKQTFTFPKDQKIIDISVGNLLTTSVYHESLIGVISLSILDSSKNNSTNSKDDSLFPTAISSKLSNDFANLLNLDASSDFVLRCSDQEFPVHKCILAARSSVFAAMFHFHNEKAKTKESLTATEIKTNGKPKKVQEAAENIVDMKPETLGKMLKYIYSGQIGDLTSTEAGELLYAADKYQLELLKKICVDKLKSTTSASNVLDMLVLGDLHDPSLKSHAMDFICKYPSLSELKKMDQWKSLQTTNPTMVIEVLTSVVGYLQDSKT